MTGWTHGLQACLDKVRVGVSEANGSLIQTGMDRLGERAEHDAEIAGAAPHLFAEAVEDALQEVWDNRWKVCKGGSSDHLGLNQITSDAQWLLCIIAKDDDWGNMCVAESVYLMATSSARCANVVNSIKTSDAGDRLNAACSFFNAVGTYDKLSRLIPTSEELDASVGGLISTWRDQSGWYWDAFEQFRGLADELLRPESIEKAVGAYKRSISEADEPVNPVEAQRPARSASGPRR